MRDQATIGLGIDEIISDKREAILKLVEYYGASNIRVFGSVARGEVRSDSDVDFLVSFPPDRSIFDLVGLWLDLKELLGREVDLSTDQGMKDYIRPHALRDAMAL